tara:strand:+ start:252 stop:1094 length:843 start_codon:yes stop_codon:yes gene_type:complete
MNKSSSKHKLKGILFSLIFHILAIASFFYFGLSYQTPPPQEKGIAINFGFNNSSNNINMEEVETPKEIKTVNNSNLITPPNNTIINQSVEETISVNEIEKKSKELITKPEIIEEEVEIVYENNEEKESEETIESDIKNEVIEEQQQVVDPKAIFSKKNKNKNLFDESKIKLGGESNVKNENIEGYESGFDGISFSLEGRNVSLKVLPDYDVQDEGIIVVLITVNRNGIVTNAITGSKGSTTFNKNLLLKAKQAALKTRFSVNNNAPISQQGKIIYNFKLN